MIKAYRYRLGPDRKLKLSQRKWTCTGCGRKNDRDLLAAINIKRFGL